MITPNRERRDWTLLVFIIPIGVILMLIAGQVAVRLVPEWSVNAGMQSNLDPNNLPMQQSGPVQPVLPAILTPLGWLDTFLTPGAGSGDQIVFPPFIVFEPSATPVVTSPPPTVATTQPPPTVPTATDSPTVVVPPATRTKPPVDETSTPPTATPPTATPPTTTATAPSTPPVGSISITPPPELGVNVPPDGNPAGLPSDPLLFPSGSYTIINLGSGSVHVSGTPDAFYDLIFYESTAPGNNTVIYLDKIVIGISKVNDGSYYEVFNWGDDNRDENTNVDFNILPTDSSPSCAEPECDNRVIPLESTAVPPEPILYKDPVSGVGTGILIDVDNAPSKPPEGDYGYLVIVSPSSGGPDEAQVDAVVVDEVPISP
jgi:hypothetical protein